MTRDEILALIEVERANQCQMWDGPGPHLWGAGDCSSPDVPMIVKAAVLGEEAGEVLQAVLSAGPSKALSDAAVRREVVQTLAVAWAILEGFPS